MQRITKNKTGAYQRQRGAVLFLFLALLMVTLTTYMISQYSLRAIRVEKQLQSIEALELAEQLLLGYAVQQPVRGHLPCPAVAIDGNATTNGSGCTQNLGFFPYQTLGVQPIYDGSGALLLYAVDDAFTLNSGATLNVDTVMPITVDGDSAVAALIAPGTSLNTTARNALNVSAFLEGTNNNGNNFEFAQGAAENENDIVRGIRPNVFWPLIEKQILADLKTNLDQYRQSCGEYPWAANFGDSDSASVSGQQVGAVPFDSALPTDWAQASLCSDGIGLSANIAQHWEGMIYYRFCLVSEGDCLTLSGDTTQNVAGILLSAGTALFAQSRSSTDVSDYFELDNSVEDTQFTSLLIGRLNAAFNDTLEVLTP